MWNEKICREGLDQPKSMIKYRTGNPGSGISGKIFSKHLFSSFEFSNYLLGRFWFLNNSLGFLQSRLQAKQVAGGDKRHHYKG